MDVDDCETLSSLSSSSGESSDYEDCEIVDEDDIKIISGEKFIDMHGITESSLPLVDISDFPTPTLKPLRTSSHWLENYKKNLFDLEDFYQQWIPKINALFAPNLKSLILSIGSLISSQLQLSSNVTDLLADLDDFICLGDSKHIYDFIKNVNKPSICGHIFKYGEPTYSCKDCGLDPTCVFCAECFKLSEHKQHKYRLATSNGGGCCDCGDKEAWTQYPHCTNHASIYTPIQGLPLGMLKRVKAIFDVVLLYLYKVLTLDPSLEGFKIDNYDNLAVDSNESYCLILYNDESHTFEQVIANLSRALKISEFQSSRIVTNIDRDGRAVLCCSSFDTCASIQNSITSHSHRHGYKHLKTFILDSYTFLHQIFALKLLEWIHEKILVCREFRLIFMQLFTLRRGYAEDKLFGPGKSILHELMIADPLLWKDARFRWHKLIIATFFRDNDIKIKFSKRFIKAYSVIMKQFVSDDQDHSDSIASLSVQIFTNPILARYLFLECDGFMIIVNTFLSECDRRVNSDHTFHFDRSISTIRFRRALYILLDLRYLLFKVPKPLSVDDKKSFLLGYNFFLTVLGYAENMDAARRQVGQHIEYEPEWESAFTLQFKLAPIVGLIILWAQSDAVLLEKIFLATIKKIEEEKFKKGNIMHLETLKMGRTVRYENYCISYDISQNPVSIHVPLCRLLAGLYVHLPKSGTDIHSTDFISKRKLQMYELMEPSLRAQVLVSQVRASMWRRNGYSTISQVHLYHSTKYRTEMQDKDILMLQIAAASMDPDEFMMHVLSKFDLCKWACVPYDRSLNTNEDSSKQLVTLIEEFFQLFISIISERYVPELSEATLEQCMLNEIIHLLCIGPMTHSEIFQKVHYEIEDSSCLTELLEIVATFKSSSNTGKSVYELKREFYKYYNVYYYHYSREESSKAEEVQRKRNKVENGEDFVLAPLLPSFCQPFRKILKLFDCQLMLHLMRITLDRAMESDCTTFSETQVNKILYLISAGLAEQEKEENNDISLNFVQQIFKFKIHTILQNLETCNRVEGSKAQIRYILGKLLQYRQWPSSSTLRDTIEEDERARKQLKSKRTRECLMAQMTQMQDNFRTRNSEFFDESKASSSTTAAAASSSSNNDQSEQKETYTCILCHTESEAKFQENVEDIIVLAAYVQNSSVLTRGNFLNADLGNSSYLSVLLGSTAHTNTCGHAMHNSCWRKHYEGVILKDIRRSYRTRPPSVVDIEQGEFLCPLCDSLSNTVLPIIPFQMITPFLKEVDITKNFRDVLFCEWYEAGLLLLKQCNKSKNETTEVIELDNDTDEPHSDFIIDPKSLNITTYHRAVNPAPAHLFGMANHNEIDSSSVIIVSDTESDKETEEVDKDQNIADTEEVVTETVKKTYTEEEFRYMSKKKRIAIQFYVDDLRMPDYSSIPNEVHKIMKSFAQTTYQKAHPGADFIPDRNAMFLAYKSIAYTFHSVETLLRYKDKPLFGQFSSRQKLSLRCMSRLATMIGLSCRLSRFQFLNTAFNYLKMLIDNCSRCPSILEWDCFALYIILMIAFKTLKMNPTSDGSLDFEYCMETHLLTAILHCHVAQILVFTRSSQNRSKLYRKGFNIIPYNNSHELKPFLNLFQFFDGENKLSTGSAWHYLQEQLTPFLRCCALFKYFLTNKEPKPYLFCKGGDSFEALCGYLNIPFRCNDLFGEIGLIDLYKSWRKHSAINYYIFEDDLKIDMTEINVLVPLPNDYSDIMDRVAEFNCPSSSVTRSRFPNMCLVCGQIMCSQSYCCFGEIQGNRVGACSRHAWTCGAGVGLFLRIRECDVLMMSTQNRGCFINTPYVDEYGETDIGLKRGNDLKFSNIEYEKLNEMWLGHTIMEELTRRLDENSLATNWLSL